MAVLTSVQATSQPLAREPKDSAGYPDPPGPACARGVAMTPKWEHGVLIPVTKQSAVAARQRRPLISFQRKAVGLETKSSGQSSEWSPWEKSSLILPSPQRGPNPAGF